MITTSFNKIAKAVASKTGWITSTVDGTPDEIIQKTTILQVLIFILMDTEQIQVDLDCHHRQVTFGQLMMQEVEILLECY